MYYVALCKGLNTALVGHLWNKKNISLSARCLHVTLKCELLPDQLWIRVESPSHNWLLTDPTLGQLLHVHPASIHSAPPAVPPLALQCRECFMNFAAYEANGVATRLNLSAQKSQILFLSHWLWCYGSICDKIRSTDNPSIWQEEPTANRAANIRLDHYLARERKAGLVGGRIFGFNAN